MFIKSLDQVGHKISVLDYHGHSLCTSIKKFIYIYVNFVTFIYIYICYIYVTGIFLDMYWPSISLTAPPQNSYPAFLQYHLWFHQYLLSDISSYHTTGSVIAPLHGSNQVHIGRPGSMLRKLFNFSDLVFLFRITIYIEYYLLCLVKFENFPL